VVAINMAVMCVTHMGKFKNAYKHFFGTTEGKRPFFFFAKPRLKKGGIKMDLKEM
jgi:hypothetical protein